MSAYATLQEIEFQRAQQYGYAAVKHQAFVGTGYFDEVAQVIAGGQASTVALKGSTEEDQFTVEKSNGNGKFGPMRVRHAGESMPEVQ